VTARTAGTDQRRRSSERLRKRPEFQAVFDEGHRASGRFLTVIVRPNALPIARLGIVASKKLGGAVQRNRAKRRIRDLFRRGRHGPLVAGHDIVVIPRRELLDAAFADLEADFRVVLGRQSRRR
jgi:ribonuclease P protein component